MDSEERQALLRNIYASLGEPQYETCIKGIGEIRMGKQSQLKLVAYTVVARKIPNTNWFEWHIVECTPIITHEIAPPFQKRSQ